jgi:hypothetical protein
MTAPIIPPATGGSGDAHKLMDMDDADFASSIGLEKTHPSPAPEPPPRDTNGKFIAKDTVLDDTTLAKETPAAEAVETPTPEVVTETPAAEAEKPAEGEPETPAEPVKPPLTKFQAVDAEGKPVDIAPVTLKFKADGKQVEYPVEKVVHLAQSNAYNARQVQELSERNTAGSQQLEQVLAESQQREAMLDQMFRDPNLYQRAQALYLASNTPERVAEATQAQLTQYRQEQQQQQESGQVAQFITGTIAPLIEDMVKEHPSLTADDVMGRIALASKQFEVNGRVPVANLPKVAHWMNTELADWAASVHTTRTEATKAQSDSLAKERAATQAKQRQMGKALAPVGANVNPTPKPATIKRAADIMNDPMFGGPQ